MAALYMYTRAPQEVFSFVDSFQTMHETHARMYACSTTDVKPDAPTKCFGKLRLKASLVSTIPIDVKLTISMKHVIKSTSSEGRRHSCAPITAAVRDLARPAMSTSTVGPGLQVL